jgi:outer membrane protein assembly factor BamB
MRSLHSVLAAVYFSLLGALVPCPAQPLTNLWQFTLPDNCYESSPAVAPDGTVYQATFYGNLVAVTAGGKLKWKFKAGREIKSSPAIGADGTIYFGSRDWTFYAVSPQGKLKWTFQTGAWVDSSPAIGADGTIYFGSWDTNFYALNPDGTLKWRFPSGGIIDSSPAIGADGTIYFGSHDKHFYALTPGGAKKWDFPTGGQIASSPAIGPDGTVYFSSADGYLYALRPDGTERWRLHTGGATESSPVLDGQGMIYLSTDNGTVGVSETGKKIWDYPVTKSLDSSPLVVSDRMVLCPAPWRDLIAQTSGGGFVWRVALDAAFNSSPALGGNGIIYVAGGPYLTALAMTNGPSSPPANDAWPMFHANPRHTGRVNAR